ncbi:hypothetical protein LINPERHAP2_LOCUS20643 [Linum perenne]
MEWKSSERTNYSSTYDSSSDLLVSVVILGVKYSRFGDQFSDYVSSPLPKYTREERQIQVCEVPITIQILLGVG